MTAVATLVGADLALWVARANKNYVDAGDGVFDAEHENYIGHIAGSIQPFAPHEDWEQGGPLIEKHTISVAKGANQICFPGWHAKVGLVNAYDPITGRQFGPTPLVAAMRALIWSVYGDNVPEVTP